MLTVRVSATMVKGDTSDGLELPEPTVRDLGFGREVWSSSLPSPMSHVVHEVTRARPTLQAREGS